MTEDLALERLRRVNPVPGPLAAPRSSACSSAWTMSHPSPAPERRESPTAGPACSAGAP